MTGSVSVIRGDARRLPLPDASVDLICTSPPYFGLRSYTDRGEHYSGQIGSEASPAEYVAALVECTREWVRVLKPEGSLFVNLGDKYGGGTWPSRHGKGATSLSEFGPKTGQALTAPAHALTAPKSLLGLPWRYALACTDQLGLILRRDIIWAKPNGLPESVTDRCRSSHEYVFHLVKQSRYFSAVDEIREPHEAKPQRRLTPHKAGALGNAARDGGRQGIMRPTVEPDGNPLGKLPGSVWLIDDDPGALIRHILHAVADGHLTPEEGERLWTGCDYVAAPHGNASSSPPNASNPVTNPASRTIPTIPTTSPNCTMQSANYVWSIPSQPLTVPPALGVDHFAAFPMELPRRIILGWSPAGVCTGCGQGRRPVTDKRYASPPTGYSSAGRWGLKGQPNDTPLPVRLGDGILSTITGYACACPEASAPTRPSLIVDPFGGTGTTALVAHALGRHGITVDMSADYSRLARWRCGDPGERARALEVPKPPPVHEDQIPMFDLAR